MAWFHIPGHHQDTVISTRVRLSRNLAEYPFPARLDAPRAKEVAGKVEGVLEKNGFSKIDFADISRTSAQSLVEKQYADPAALRESLPHALFLNEPCSLSVMVCQEDHVRLQSIRAGLALGDAFEGASKMEAQLDAELPFAFDKHLGYLTGNPAELGTAMRVSVLLCLPLLTAGQRMESFALQMGQLGLLLRCVYEGGALYGLSNRVTLGFTEEELLARVGLAADMLIRAEENYGAASQMVNPTASPIGFFARKEFCVTPIG
jgi:protein arginine kinase